MRMASWFGLGLPGSWFGSVGLPCIWKVCTSGHPPCCGHLSAWQDVRRLLHKVLEDLPKDVDVCVWHGEELCNPLGMPAHPALEFWRLL